MQDTIKKPNSNQAQPDYASVIAGDSQVRLNQATGITSQVVAQNAQVAALVEQSGTKTQEALAYTAQIVDQATSIGIEAEAISLLRAKKKQELTSEIIPQAQTDLIKMNETVRSTRDSLTEATQQFEAVGAHKDSSVVEDLASMFGIPTQRDAAFENVRLQQAKYDMAIRQRDTLENTITDTSLLVNDRLKSDEELLKATNDVKNKLLVNQGEAAKQEIVLKSINANVDFAIKVKALNEQSLNALMSQSATQYQAKKDVTEANWRQGQAELAAQESIERRLASKENRDINRTLKAQNQYSRQAELVYKRLGRGADQFRKLSTGVQSLGTFAPQSLMDDTVTLGSKLNTREAVQSEIGLIYTEMATSPTGMPAPELQAKLQSELVKLSAADRDYRTLETKITGERTKAYIEKTKYDQAARDKYLANLNAIRTAGGAPKFESLDQFDLLGKDNKKYVGYMNMLATKMVDGHESVDLVASPDPVTFVANVELMGEFTGSKATSKLLGEDAVEVYSILKEHKARLFNMGLLSPKKAEQEAQLNAAASRDSKVAQYNSLNPSAPTNEFSKLFQFKADDFYKLEGNPLAQSLGAVVKQSGTVLNLDMLMDFTTSAVMAKIDEGKSYSVGISEVATSLSSIFGAVYGSKFDVHSLGLGASDRPIITSRTNTKGTTKNPTDLSNPSHIIKYFLSQKQGSIGSIFPASKSDVVLDVNAMEKALEFTPDKSTMKE